MPGDMAPLDDGVPDGRPSQALELLSTIGFNGKVSDGLVVHPNRETIIYPLGCTLVVEKISGKKKQSFLQGHSSTVTCIAVSSDGRYVASGQETYQGFKADIIVWDFETMSELYRFVLHKVKVQSLAFSPNSKFLASLGGSDDGNVVIWDLETGDAVCGHPAAMETAGTAEVIAFTNGDDYTFVSAGEYTIRVWSLDVPNRKIHPTDCIVRSLRRKYKSIAISADDELAYCGTSTGDIVSISITGALLKGSFPKTKLSQGVTSMLLLKNGEFVAGTGSGSVCLIKGSKIVKEVKLGGKAISSITPRGEGHEFYVGSENGVITRFSYSDFSHETRSECHSSGINAVQFPADYSELYGTCSLEEIRVWRTKNNQEMLRISIPNLECNSFSFMPDGHSILSGWSDGRVRAYTPESGRQMYEIPNAHNMGVKVVVPTNDCTRIITGGGDGCVRVWAINYQSQTLLMGMKEHKGAITDIKVRQNDKECISSSIDGTCIVWDMTRGVRNQILLCVGTQFTQVAYRPDEAQILTCGSDRKIGYWESYDGSLIRELDGSQSGSLTAMDIAASGENFATGGQDMLVKVWKYHEGEAYAVGAGHSGHIKCLKMSPDQSFIVSCSEDGGIFRWKME